MREAYGSKIELNILTIIWKIYHYACSTEEIFLLISPWINVSSEQKIGIGSWSNGLICIVTIRAVSKRAQTIRLDYNRVIDTENNNSKHLC